MAVDDRAGSDADYFVLLHKGQWKVEFHGAQYGPYATQQDAIGAAIATAHQASKFGHQAQVLVQGPDRGYRTAYVLDGNVQSCAGSALGDAATAPTGATAVPRRPIGQPKLRLVAIS